MAKPSETWTVECRMCLARSVRRSGCVPIFRAPAGRASRRTLPSIRAGSAWEDAGMRTIQLRRYTLVDGEYDAFVAWWQDWMPRVRPARRLRDRVRLRPARDERVRLGRQRRGRRGGVPRPRAGVHGLRCARRGVRRTAAAGRRVQHPLRRRHRFADASRRASHRRSGVSPPRGRRRAMARVRRRDAAARRRRCGPRSARRSAGPRGRRRRRRRARRSGACSGTATDRSPGITSSWLVAQPRSRGHPQLRARASSSSAGHADSGSAARITLPGAPTPTGCRVPGRCATEATPCRGSTRDEGDALLVVEHRQEARHAELVRRGGEFGERLGLQVVRDARGERAMRAPSATRPPGRASTRPWSSSVRSSR